MAYLAREQSIKEWASLVTNQEVPSLKKIQEIQFIVQLLTSLDYQYFKPAFSDSQNITFSHIFSEMSEYYSKVIGTNVRHLIGDDVNIYSSKAIEQIWQLILGIAIKGRDRQKNINKILNMGHNSQEQLMKVISKVISKVGDIVSGFQPEDTSLIGQNQNYGGQNANIILQLSEENEQLKEKIEECLGQIKALKEKKDLFQKQLEEKKKERNQILNILTTQSSQFRNMFSDGNTSLSGIADFIRDLIIQVNRAGKELSKKQEKVNFLQQINKQLKLAYSSALVEMDSIKKIEKEATTDIKDFQKELELLRAENLEMVEKQRDLVNKIQELQEQKYYLKGIVQRFENNFTISEQKIDELIKKKQQKLLKEQKMNQNGQQYDSLTDKKEQFGFKIQKSEIGRQGKPQKTVKYEIDQINQPSLRNKLQRQVSHLQKKINSLQQQNLSLKKINEILQKTINQFTEESQGILKKCQEQFEPLFKELTISLNNQSGEKEQMQEFIKVVREKLLQNDDRNLKALQIIRKLQLQRDQLINTIKQMQQGGDNKISIKSNKKHQLGIFSQKNEIQVKNESIPQQPVKEQKMLQLAVKKIQQLPVISLQIPKTSEYSQYSEIEQPQPTINVLSIPSANNTPNKNLQSFIEDGQEEQFNRRRQYSFMANRISAYKMGSQIQFGIKQMNPHQGIENSHYIGTDTLQLNSNNSIEQNTFDEDYDDGNLFDITEIEEQLQKVKDKFISVNQKTKQLYQIYVKKKQKNSQSPQQSSKKFAQIIDMFQKSSSEEIGEKKYQRDTGVFSPQLVRLHHENKALRRQLNFMAKEKSKLMEGLQKKDKGEAIEAEAIENRHKIQKLNEVIRCSKDILAESEAKYLQLYEYFSQVVENSDSQAQISCLRTQLQASNATCHQQNGLIQQLGLELRVLSSAFLELRNQCFS